MNIDAVICTYNESIEKINLTLQGCINQTISFRKIYLVDDASNKIRISTEKLIKHPSICLIILKKNKGISGARNTALELSDAEYVACINIEVVPEKNWLKSCIDFLFNTKDAGCVFGKVTPYKHNLLSLWRMRFHEIQFNTITSGSTYMFAPGHAVLFRKKAIQEIGYYKESLKLTHEDADICERLKIIGYKTYYIDNVLCTSYQEDKLLNLAKKHIVRLPGLTVSELSYKKFLYWYSKDFFYRISRNIYKFRFKFIPIDILVYLLGFYFFYKQKK